MVRGPAGSRLNGPARITGVDLARGLAVIGMLAAHLITIDPLVWTDPATWPAIVQGRSSILFATLAGVSIGIVTGGRTPWMGERMSTARLRLVARAFFLWVLGVLLITTGVPILVILPAYAILFLLAIPFTGFRSRTLFVIAGGLALVTPFLAAFIDALPLWDGDAGAFLGLLIGWRYPVRVVDHLRRGGSRGRPRRARTHARPGRLDRRRRCPHARGGCARQL